MDAEENRWNTTFVREISKALDEIENDEGPGALITSSTNPKFFSNGLDLDWMQAPENHPEGGDKEVFGEEFMYLMGRFITLPIPTVCAINGHAFGAGFMFALSHDVRIMREDRGFLCANEMQLGLSIPRPELALFKHKVPANTFFETVKIEILENKDEIEIGPNFFPISNPYEIKFSFNDLIARVCAFSGSTLNNSGLSLENIILIYSLTAR